MVRQAFLGVDSGTSGNKGLRRPGGTDVTGLRQTAQMVTVGASHGAAFLAASLSMDVATSSTEGAAR